MNEFGRSGWQLGPFEVSSDLRAIAGQWDYVEAILEDEELRTLRRDDVSSWSCGEQAEHLILSGGWIGKQLVEHVGTSSVSEPSFGSAESDSDSGPAGLDVTAEATRRLLESGFIPRGAAEAPQPMQPRKRERSFWTERLQRVREIWDSIAKTPDLETSPIRFRHPALGSLAVAEWVRFSAVHGAHHLAIVEDIRKTSP